MADHVVQVAVPRPLHAVYDYAIDTDTTLQVGTRVRVPFGKSHVVGVVVETDVENAHPKLKFVDEVLDEAPILGSDLIDLARWMERYYHHPLGEVLATLLPVAARKGAPADIDPPDVWQIADTTFANARAKAQTKLFETLTEHGQLSGAELVAMGQKRETLRKLVSLGVVERAEPTLPGGTEVPPPPNPEQTEAITAITSSKGNYGAFLLEGVTGSGKTEVYLRAIDTLIETDGQALVLVPEIALTPQTLRRFERRFGQVGMLHSQMTDHERFQVWLRARRGQLRVVVGTRSAIFTPFANLSLIVVDEEHDSSYKQQDGLRYSARDVAIKRAADLSIPVVLGSATPSLESFYNVRNNRYKHLLLPHRAGGATMPGYHIIDMRGEQHTDGVSSPLTHVIRRHLNAQGQVIVFLNRRGFAPTLLCTGCGWQSTCPSCDARMTLHTSPRMLACHHCGLRLEIPQVCDSCNQKALLPVGLGTQRTEAGLAKLFPEVPVLRIDRDTTRTTTALEAKFDKINEGNPCILVGTQMLAKGHHFPNVTLVVILNADAGFLSPDFRAPERTAQLIVQVAGRAGRAERPGEVWIQSYQPENPALKTLIEKHYSGFAELELQNRIDAGMPPAAPMALIHADAFEANDAIGFLNGLKVQLGGLEVLGPVPAPLARIANRSRFQLMLIAESRARLHAVLANLKAPKVPNKLRWSLDVDPYDSS